MQRRERRGRGTTILKMRVGGAEGQLFFKMRVGQRDNYFSNEGGTEGQIFFKKSGGAEGHFSFF